MGPAGQGSNVRGSSRRERRQALRRTRAGWRRSRRRRARSRRTTSRRARAAGERRARAASGRAGPSAARSEASTSRCDRTGPAVRKKDEHRPLPVHHARDAGGAPRACSMPRARRSLAVLEIAIRLPVAGGQHVEGGGAGGDRDRISRQRAGLVDVPGRRDALHQLARAGVGGDRQPAADHLGQAGEIGLDAEADSARRPRRRGSRSSPRRTRAARRDACRARASRARKPARRRHHAHVAGDRLDDDRGDRSLRWRGRAPRPRSRSLYGASSVCAVTAAGTPGDDGTPRVAAPEPAATRKASAAPW